MIERTAELAQFFAAAPDQLLHAQRPAVRIIIDQISRIIDRRMSDKGAPLHGALASAERPHQVFVIDGGRGAGKTYTLLSVERALGELTRECAGQPTAWSGFFSGLPNTESLRSRLRAAPTFTRVADVARIIFQGDLIDQESVMESIFAHMSESLSAIRKGVDDRRKVTTASSATVAEIKDAERFSEDLRLLATRLREEVSQGWYFAQRFGLEALIRDSFDYKDLVERWTDESRRSSHRIDAWRKFVDDYLDVQGAAVLVVMIDDSDVEARLTAQVLHAIRMFLNHPRIVTVLAGNLKSMRDSLLQGRLEVIGAAVPALNEPGHVTARDWRQRERQMIEEYLEKVLPPAKRIQIRPAAANPANGPEDFKRVAGERLEDYLRDAMDKMREPFLATKFGLALDHEFGRADAPRNDERARLDGFLAWWFFAHIYAESLAPRTPRQIETFRAYYEDWLRPEREQRLVSSPKRLPVMLFDNPANFTLAQRLGDEDSSVLEWLRRQQLASSWSGRRSFIINERETYEGSYTYVYLRYRMDVGIGLPVRHNAEESVPVSLLPQTTGRQLMRRFMQPRATPRRHRALGVSRWLNHAAVPSNCVYFNDLQALPDVSLIDAETPPEKVRALQSGQWESELAERWTDLIDDRQENEADERLVRYFREVVCQSLRFTADVSSAELLLELDPPDVFEKQRFGIYEHFLQDELGIFTAPPLQRQAVWLAAYPTTKESPQAVELDSVTSRLRDALKRKLTIAAKSSEGVIGKGTVNWPPMAPRRMIALYAAMVTDLRRAWHAIRVQDVSPLHMGGTETGSGREMGQRTALSVVRSRDRMTLYEREDIKNVLERSEWVKAMMDLFDLDNITASLGDPTGNASHYRQLKSLHLLPVSIERIFSAAKLKSAEEEGEAGDDGEGDENIGITEISQIEQEPQDFLRWTKTLRSLGRVACDDWPVHDGSDVALQIERDLFANGRVDLANLLLVFGPNLTADESEQMRRNGRAARNLVWLLYGLAPSLPAVIHTHIMSQVYEAETFWKAWNDVQSNKDLEPTLSREGARREMLKVAARYYANAVFEIDAWARLIGTLSALLRYIKIKTLHIDTVLLLEAWQKRLDTDSGEALKRTVRDVLELMGESKYLHDDDDVDLDKAKAQQFLSALWSVFQPKGDDKGRQRLAQLAIFPDVAPSTLFGDKWVKDIMSRKGVRKSVIERCADLNLRDVADDEEEILSPGDDPLMVSGVFGETEQWLWSANRTLRKLHAVIEPRNQNLQELFRKATRPTENAS